MTINQRDHVVGLLDHEEWNLHNGGSITALENAATVANKGRRGALAITPAAAEPVPKAPAAA